MICEQPLTNNVVSGTICCQVEVTANMRFYHIKSQLTLRSYAMWDDKTKPRQANYKNTFCNCEYKT